jgi:Cu/Ag efflux protein CusF
VRFAMGLLVFALGALISISAAPAQEQHGYLVTVVGRVVTVDRASGRIVLHHGMLETVDAGDVTCTVPPDRLRYIQPGMELSAVADTRHRTWRLIDIRHFHGDSGSAPGSSGVASGRYSQRIVSQGIESVRV